MSKATRELLQRCFAFVMSMTTGDVELTQEQQEAAEELLGDLKIEIKKAEHDEESS